MTMLELGQEPAETIGAAEPAIVWSPADWVGDADDAGYVVDWQIESDDSAPLVLPPTEIDA